MSREPLTEKERAAYKLVAHAANRGNVCPTNEDIACNGGYASSGRASAILGSVEQKGWIVIYRGNHRRVVMVTETGKFTAGTMPKPHWRDKGKPPREIVLPPQVVFKVRQTQVEKREQAPEPINRDPCFMCGVRADIGCSHRRAA